MLVIFFLTIKKSKFLFFNDWSLVLCFWILNGIVGGFYWVDKWCTSGKIGVRWLLEGIMLFMYKIGVFLFLLFVVVCIGKFKRVFGQLVDENLFKKVIKSFEFVVNKIVVKVDLEFELKKEIIGVLWLDEKVGFLLVNEIIDNIVLRLFVMKMDGDGYIFKMLCIQFEGLKKFGLIKVLICVLWSIKFNIWL